MTTTSRKHKSVLNRLKLVLNLKGAFFFIISVIILHLASCATQQQPGGGPKDETPPKILSVVPENLTRNFHEKEILITFDEFVRLKNEFTEISISPDMETAPSYKVKRKTLVITLPDTLEQNTTYAINFGNAITDFNEGNELKNFSYVFSTGPEIDSLSIKGTVTNSLTLEKEKELTVFIIPTSQDSIFGKKKANIFTRTDSAGNFALKNLHEGTYRIYALQEKNNDRIYNSPDELIGFLKDSIHLVKDTSGINLQVFKEIPKDFRILNRTIDNKGKISIIFNKTIENPSLTLLNEPKLDQEKITEFSKTNDTAYVWLPEITFDSLQIQIKEGSAILDTTMLKRNKKDEYDRKLVLTDNLTSRTVDKIRNIVVTSSAPIKSFDKSKIKLMEDSVARDNFQITLDTFIKRQAVIKYNWKAKKSYQIKFEEGAFTGEFAEKSVDGERNFTYDDTENFGDIILSVEVPDSNQHYILELLGDKDVIIKSNLVHNSEKILYKNIPGAKYRIRVIYDDNNNGKWDTGNVEKRIQPEKLWYWEKTMTIRPNWEQEETITIPPKTTIIKPKEDIPVEKDDKEQELLQLLESKD